MTLPTMPRYLVFIVMIFTLTTTCKKQDSLTLFHSFPNNTWSRFEKQQFTLMIGDISRPYDVYLILRHDDSYPFNNLYIHVILYMPDSEERVAEYDFDVKDTNGDFLSVTKNGYREITFMLRKGLRFTQEGPCTIELENLIPRIEIRGIKELGIRLEKTSG